MVGLDVDPQTIVSTLSIGKQQLVEIAKRSARTHASSSWMNPPHRFRSTRQTNYSMWFASCARGVSVLYISHRLREVEELADRVVVLRDGKTGGQLSRDENSRQNMIRLMIGREVSRFYQRTSHGRVRIVGLPSATFARRPFRSRRIRSVRAARSSAWPVWSAPDAPNSWLRSSALRPPSAGAMVASFVGRRVRAAKQSPPESCSPPKTAAVPASVLPMSVKTNLSLASLRRDQRVGFLNHWAENRVAGHDRTHANQNVERPTGRSLLLRRQSAKGGLGKWLCLTQAAAARRANSRDRCRGQGGNLQADG